MNNTNTDTKNTNTNLSIAIHLILIFLSFVVQFMHKKTQQISLKSKEITQKLSEQSKEKIKQIAEILHFKNPHPGIFHFENKIIKEQPSLAKYVDDYTLGHIEAFSNLDAILKLEPFFDKTTSYLSKNANLHGSQFKREFDSRINSEVCGIYGIDVLECESDLQSEKFNAVANEKYKDALKSVNSEKELTNLIKAINHIIIKGRTGKSEFGQGGTHILFKPGAPKPWEKLEAQIYIQHNNPELLAAYNKFFEFIDNILTEVKMHVKNSHQYKIITNLSPEEKFSTLAQFYNELKPILIKKSDKMEFFLTEYVSILHSSEKAHDLINVGIKKLFNKLKAKSIDPYEVASYAHQMIVGSHAFEDGNGRTARLLMNLILQKHGIEPIIFYSNEDYSNIVRQSLNQSNHLIFSNYLRFLNDQRPAIITFFKDMQKQHDANKNFEDIREKFDINKKTLPRYKLNSSF